MQGVGDSCRVALVGCGRWGRLIARDLVDLGAEVTVIDPSPDAAAFSSVNSLRWHRDLAELDGSRLDGVVVATEASSHAAVLVQVAPFGVPVFCEKPLTVDVEAAARCVDLLAGRLHVMHVWRYHRGIELLGELARSGVLGEIHGVRTTRTNWTSPRTDVDSLWTLVPHDLTIGIEVLGSAPTPRAAMVESLDGRAVSMWAHLGGGPEPWLVIEASTRFADKRREVRVHGSMAVASLASDAAAEIVIVEGTALEPKIRSVSFVNEPPLRRQLAAWLDFTRGGPPPKSSGAEGLAVVTALTNLRGLAQLEAGEG